MPTRVTSWINEVNTTSFRILASVFGAIINITAIQVALLMGWAPTEIQLKVLIGEAGVLLTMMGFDVIQFASKRFSDKGLAAAKAGTVNVEQAGTVVAAPPAPPAPEPTVPVGATPRTPEKGDDP